MAGYQENNFFADIEKKIRQLAKSNGITLLELVRQIDMTEAGFYKMLSSESMKLKTLVKIAEVLKTPVTGFFNEQGGKYSSNVPHLLAEPDGTYNQETANLYKQIALLESQIADKNRIIQLLEQAQK